MLGCLVCHPCLWSDLLPVTDPGRSTCHPCIWVGPRQVTDAIRPENGLVLNSMGRRKKQLAFELKYRGRGGYREGAGRPKKPGAGVPHTRRPELAARHPVHVTARVRDEAARLRSRVLCRLILHALGAGGSATGSGSLTSRC